MFRRLAPLCAAALVLAACGGGDDTDASPAATNAAAATDAPSAVDEPASGGATGTALAALQFSAPLVGGGQIDLAELGDKPVLLWFWAPW